MRALVCTKIGGEEFLEVQDDWPAPKCGLDQVRIAVHAASVNFPDVLIIRDLYQLKKEPPFVPGAEVSGVVTEVGADVSAFSVGDRVLSLTGLYGFAEEVVVGPPLQPFRMPDAMPWDEGAALNLTYGTAAHGFQRGQLRKGETVLVLGAAGGCGSAGIEVAKAMGATVIAVAGGAEKVELCRRLGADQTIDHQAVESLSGAVKALTDGRGVDVLFDTVGGATVREHLRCMAWNGRYLVIGFAAGEVPSIGLNQTILKSISVVGVAYGASAIADPADNRALLEQLFTWYEAGKLKPAIGGRFSLDDGADAIRMLSERRALGKVVIEIQPSS